MTRAAAVAAARIVKRCQDIPGYELFQYLDDEDRRCAIDSADVNEYLREISGDDFTARDFRTWAGTVLAVGALQAIGAAETQTAAKRNLTLAITRVAEQLGNTPAVCRKCYVHPVVLDGYLGGSLLGALAALTETAAVLEGLRADEAIVLAFLRASHAEDAEPLASKLARSLAH